MPRTKLSVVPADAKAVESPRTLSEAVKRTERDVLVTMRARLAAEIDGDIPPHTLAPLVRQLREIDKDIRLLDLKAKQEGAEDGVSPDESFDASAV